MQCSQIITYTFVEEDKKQLSPLDFTKQQQFTKSNDVAELRPQICEYMYTKLIWNKGSADH